MTLIPPPAYQKTPGENIAYRFDWSLWLGSDTISGSLSTWTVAAGLSAGTATNTTTTATQPVSGGALGQDYVLENTVTTAAGRIGVRRLIVQVRNK